MIPRYTRPEMKELWSDEAKYRAWLSVELATTEALAKRGLVPPDDLAAIREKAGFDVSRIAAIEAEVKHDVIAFLTSVAEKIGPAARHVHYGLTSSDVVDTAQALILVRACDLLLGEQDALLGVLKRRALEHKRTIMVGRTHGIHAEPTTWGHRVADLAFAMARSRDRLRRAREAVAVAKISGAVGTYSNIGENDQSIE